MNNTELKDIVAPYISGSTITEITEQDDFFIVYFVNNEFYETKDIKYMLVGAGPLLVNKTTKQIFETSSGQIPTYCIQSYHKTGSINSQPSNIIKIQSCNKTTNKAKAIMLLKKQCTLKSAESKDIIEKALNSISSTIELESSDLAEQAAITLDQAGFVVEQLWQ